MVEVLSAQQGFRAEDPGTTAVPSDPLAPPPPSTPQAQTSSPLRILYHHRVAAADGMRVHITELIEALRAHGHEVLVVGPGSQGGEDRGGRSTPLERLADLVRACLPPAVFEGLELLYNAPAYWRLGAAAKAFKPDVLYERYNLFLLAGLLLKRRLGLPLIMEINAPLAEERAKFGNLKLKALGRRCEAALWAGADVALPVTDVLAQIVRQKRPDGAVVVVPNGANLSRPPAARADGRARLGLDKDALVLGFVGFVKAWHGLAWAVEALADLPPRTHLVVVGDGPGAAELRQRAEQLGVKSRVHLLGRVPHDEVAGYMQSFDIALQTAAVPYCSPLKLFEYMALERAVIAPDQPNIREVLTHDRDALLFEPGNRAAFVSALHRLSHDAALRERLGRAAGRTIREHPYTWAHNARRIGELARALITREAPSALAPEPPGRPLGTPVSPQGAAFAISSGAEIATPSR